MEMVLEKGLGATQKVLQEAALSVLLLDTDRGTGRGTDRGRGRGPVDRGIEDKEEKAGIGKGSC